MTNGTIKLHKSLVMVGMMGAGKTAVGRGLATRLGVPFLDSDEALVEAAAMSIPEIFARDGEAFFRQKEAQIIQRLMTEGPPCVLSVGGGAFLAETTRDLIAKNGLSVWLDAELEVLWDRVRHKDTRPLLRTPNPKQTLSDLLQARRAHYAKAQLRVQSLPGLSVEDMVDRVIEALRTQPEALYVGDPQP